MWIYHHPTLHWWLFQPLVFFCIFVFVLPLFCSCKTLAPTCGVGRLRWIKVKMAVSKYITKKENSTTTLAFAPTLLLKMSLVCHYGNCNLETKRYIVFIRYVEIIFLVDGFFKNIFCPNDTYLLYSVICLSYQFISYFLCRHSFLYTSLLPKTHHYFA